MKYVRSSRLEPGCITASALYDNKNRLMLAPNTPLTESLINRIRELDFHGVYVLSDSDDTSYAPLLDDERRQEAIQSLKSLEHITKAAGSSFCPNSVIYRNNYDRSFASPYN